jgi:hypothetical protein
MHMMEINGWTVHHNGDFSGHVEIVRPDKSLASSVPFEVLEAVVAEKIRRERIAALEEAPASFILDERSIALRDLMERMPPRG